ncbi:MAG: TrkH family potassium uptake protein [Clostridia bacterium]|nr:TrkH family potassium uptake protein [Clostridia bacterium]
MNRRMIGYLLGVILLIEALFMIFPSAVALIYSESVLPFVITIGLIALISLPLVLLKPQNTQIYAKEGFITVALGWIVMSAFGALPFTLSGAIPNYIDAVFEAISGFTTTGATILSEIESLPKGILFWRSLTHWLGGMGVLVFMLAILPSAGGQTMHLMRAEVPGPTKGKLVPKMRLSSLILYGIYVTLTAIQVAVLLLFKMPLYDSLVTAFGTAGTGGFSVLNNSIAGYNSPAIEWVVAIFMLLFGINFNIYFFILMGKVKDVLKSEELRTYLLICAVTTVVITANIASTFNNLSDAFRASFFQVTSIISTSGFSTVDFNLWPSLSKTLLILIMITGACAGSTAGGLKLSRVMILFKNAVKEIRHIRRPRSVNVIKLDGEAVPADTVRSATGYLTVYLAVFIASVILISIDGFSFESNFSSVLTTINNVGPGFDALGPMSNFSVYSYFSKIVLSLDMLIGRLEILPMMILFSSIFGKRK